MILVHWPVLCWVITTMCKAASLFVSLASKIDVKRDAILLRLENGNIMIAVMTAIVVFLGFVV